MWCLLFFSVYLIYSLAVLFGWFGSWFVGFLLDYDDVGLFYFIVLIVAFGLVCLIGSTLLLVVIILTSLLAWLCSFVFGPLLPGGWIGWVWFVMFGAMLFAYY